MVVPSYLWCCNGSVILFHSQVCNISLVSNQLTSEYKYVLRAAAISAVLLGSASAKTDDCSKLDDHNIGTWFPHKDTPEPDASNFSSDTIVIKKAKYIS
jgi:hypothetical protein